MTRGVDRSVCYPDDVLQRVERIPFIAVHHERVDLPQLIVLDQNMPMMNGKQTLQALKSHARYTRIPAVIYSTYTDSDLISDCKRLGAGLVAVKPIDDEGYQKMMDDFLRVIEVSQS